MSEPKFTPVREAMLRLFFGHEHEPEDYGHEGSRVGCGKCIDGATEVVADLYAALEAAGKERDELLEALQWCSGASDFQPGGFARQGWEKIRHLVQPKVPIGAALAKARGEKP